MEGAVKKTNKKQQHVVIKVMIDVTFTVQPGEGQWRAGAKS